MKRDVVGNYFSNLIWLSAFYEKKQMLLYMILQVLLVLCELMIPVQIGNILGELFEQQGQNSISLLVKKLLIVVICSTVVTVVSNLQRVSLKEKPVLRIQKETMKHLFDLGVPYFETSEKEHIFSVFTTTIPMVRDIYDKYLPTLLYNVICVIFSLGFFVYFSNGWALIVIFALIPNVFLHNYFNTRISAEMVGQIAKRKRFDQNIYSSISAMRDIRAYQCENWQKRKIEQSYQDYKTSRLNILRIRYARGTFFRLNTAFGITIYFVIAILLMLHGSIMVNSLVTCFFYCTKLIFIFNGLVYQITEMYPVLQHTNDLRRFLDEEPNAVDIGGELRVTKLEKNIQVKGVSFSYKNRENILKNISFNIYKGDKILIVGKSGIGKTTLLKIIGSLYKVDKGQVLWDGIDYSAISNDCIRDMIGYVFQESYLFAGSIMENIRIGNVDASDEEVYHAARIACVDEFAKELSDGYATKVGERGVFLSGGQKQRIAIARLVLKNPELVILDEATSNLDEFTEKKIFENLLCKFFPNKTVVAISHRRTNDSYFSRILEMDENGIRETMRKNRD